MRTTPTVNALRGMEEAMIGDPNTNALTREDSVLAHIVAFTMKAAHEKGLENVMLMEELGATGERNASERAACAAKYHFARSTLQSQTAVNMTRGMFFPINLI